ncbi:MAG: metallophosphoesterase family protein [Bacteroidales bacterium]
MKNYWFIGDIHGEVSLLNKLLEQVVRFDPEEIIFVGDYIDRGPYSKQVIDRIMELDVPAHCLLGNHEMLLLDALESTGFGHSPVELWYYNGGETTLQSFGFNSFFSFQSDMEPEYLRFFRNLRMNHVVHMTDQQRVMAVHAGVSPAIPLEDQMNMKNYRDLNKYMQEHHIDPGDSFLWVREDFFNSPPGLWDGYLLVHGHTPVLKLKRFISRKGQKNFLFVEDDLCIRKETETGKIVSIDIDSGSAVSGRLTGLGFFMGNEGEPEEKVRMRSLTVTAGEIIPRDLGVAE